MKFSINIVFLWICISGAMTIMHAQPGTGHAETLRQFAEAEELYYKHNPEAAYEKFSQLKKEIQDNFLLPDIDYYLTVLEIARDEPYSEEKIRRYLLLYPYSPYRDRLRLLLIDQKFAEGKYHEVKRLIDRTEIYNLSGKEQERLKFYRAYIALKNNDLNTARKLFKELEQSKEYADQAHYYLGYIAYLKNNIAEAQRYFNRVKNKKLARGIPYYNAHMYYRAGDFEKAVQEALKIYPRSRGKEKIELAEIIGSSYFNMKQYDKAIPYLEIHLSETDKLSPKDYYELGYAYYKTGNCRKATNYFNKIIDADDALAQNAYYHLGKCYLQTGNKNKALNAFKKVAETEYNPMLREDAGYQYIKLSYETGNPYEPLHAIIEKYLQTYPHTPYKDELQELLVRSYITSRNYAAALQAMKKKGMTRRPEFQKVALLRGLELFREGKYDKAVRHFDLSLKYGTDPVERNRAVFWKAEALYRSGKYDDALTEYKSLETDTDRLPSLEKTLYPYNLGYVYFKLKDYDQAARYFSQYLKTSSDSELAKDAWIRLGDSYFALRKYWPAIDAYNRAVHMGGPDTDYAYYQKAVSYGFAGKTRRKIEELQKFPERYPRSPLADDALYQLGSTYLNIERYDKAAEAFKTLIRRHPRSPYVPAAMLKTGLAYYNQGDNIRAKQSFEKLITTHPHTPEALEAADYLKEIYMDENNPDGFLTFINGIPGFNVESRELEQEFFRAAENKYFEKKYPAAKEAFAAYLKRFPDGAYKAEALRYAAKTFLHLNLPDSAYTAYARLAELPAHPYSAEVFRFLATRDLQAGHDNQAAEHLEKLLQTARNDDDKLFAALNLMRIYARKGDNERASEYARMVLENPKHDSVNEIEAKRILAREAVRNGNWEEAERLYDELRHTASGETAAEALYYKALILHRKGEYEASDKTVAELAEKYPSYKYWSGKALLVMARNMNAKGDVFNATYILENLIERFQDYPEITEEARQLLRQIKNRATSKKSRNENNPEHE